MIEIKKCPFCGCQPKLRKGIYFPKWKQGAVEAWKVVCTNYKCVIFNANEQYADSEISAINAWNNRSNGWISVKDRLPEKSKEDSDYSGDVIVTDGKRISIGYYSYLTDSWVQYYDDVFSYCIHHWMPIPELPEEVNENDEP